jgi:hypothetical protein
VGGCFQLGVLKAHFSVPGHGFQGASMLGYRRVRFLIE